MKRWPLAREHDPGAEIESWPQQLVGQIGARFIDGADAVKLSRRGLSETDQLRKDEPHPVVSLPAGESRSPLQVENARSRLFVDDDDAPLVRCEGNPDCFEQRP
jgi:hypothetical protein